MKRENEFRILMILSGCIIIFNAVYSMLWSTDLFWQFQVGRIIRLIIGVGMIKGFWKNYYFSLFGGGYLLVEGMLSFIVSPDNSIFIFQIGWIFRIIGGAMLLWINEVGDFNGDEQEENREISALAESQ